MHERGCPSVFLDRHHEGAHLGPAASRRTKRDLRPAIQSSRRDAASRVSPSRVLTCGS